MLRIGDLVVAAGLLSREKLEEIMAARGHEGRRLLGRIHALGVATERQLASVLANHAGVPVVVLSETPLDLLALRSLPEAMLRERVILPVAADEKSVTVVSAEPDAADAVNALALLAGRRVTWFLGIHGAVTEQLERALAAAAAGETSLPPQLGAGKQIALALPPTPEEMRLAGFAELLVHAGFDASILARATRVVGLAPPTSWPTVVAEARPELVLPAVPLPPEGKRVALVVDDDKAIRDLVTRTLEHDDYSVFAAADGSESIALLRVIYPDVIVLDAMMPGLHGFEILAALRQSPTHREIPVIVCSAVYAEWAHARAIEETHGADAFLAKPFGLAQLRGLVAQLTKREVPRWGMPPGAAERVKELFPKAERAVADNAWMDADMLTLEWIALDPFSPRGWLARGDVLLARGNAGAALHAFENASLFGHDDVVAQLSFAAVAGHFGFRRRAIAVWQRIRSMIAHHEDQAQLIDGYLDAIRAG